MSAPLRGRARQLLESFVDALLSNRYADAERAMTGLRDRLAKKGEWGEGYIFALRGLLDAKRANDRHAFRLDALEDPKELRELRREFDAHAKARYHADFDRGYFSAMRDVMSVLMKKARAQAQKPQTV